MRRRAAPSIMHQRQHFRNSWGAALPPPVCRSVSSRLSSSLSGVTVADLPLLPEADVSLNFYSVQCLHSLFFWSQWCLTLFLFLSFSKAISHPPCSFSAPSVSIKLVAKPIRSCIRLWEGLDDCDARTRARVSLKVIVRFGTYLSQCTGPLCCFILETWKRKKPPQNSPVSGKDRFRQTHGVGGWGMEEKKVWKGLETEL